MCFEGFEFNNIYVISWIMSVILWFKRGVRFSLGNGEGIFLGGSLVGRKTFEGCLQVTL